VGHGSKLYWYGSGGVRYYAEDLLGSARVMVNATGSVCYDADFTPFGGERAYTSACAGTFKFEGKERDAETQCFPTSRVPPPGRIAGVTNTATTYGAICFSQAGWSPTYHACTEGTMTAVTADGGVVQPRRRHWRPNDS